LVSLRIYLTGTISVQHATMLVPQRRKGDHGQDARDAETILRLDPYRETAYLRLMLAHAAAGNRASALLAYERCRARLTAELGTSPGAAIQELHLDLLRAR
jgi:DNA-binding SARP family transcriptional activator